MTERLKLLTDRRAQILARVGDDYVVAPPKLPAKTVIGGDDADSRNQKTCGSGNKGRACSRGFLVCCCCLFSV